MAKSQEMNMNLTQEQIKMMANALRNATDIVCQKCGHNVFSEAVRIKKISKLLTGDTEDKILSIPTAICVKCQTELVLNNEEKAEKPKDVIEVDFRKK